MRNVRQLLIAIITVFVFQTVSFAQDSKSKEKLTIEEFEYKLYSASKNAQILDARSSEEYKLNHIKNSLDFSFTTDVELQKKVDLLDKNKPSFIYSIGQGRSGVLAKKLKAQGFNEVYELPGCFS